MYLLSGGRGPFLAKFSGGGTPVSLFFVDISCFQGVSTFLWYFLCFRRPEFSERGFRISGGGVFLLSCGISCILLSERYISFSLFYWHFSSSGFSAVFPAYREFLLFGGIFWLFVGNLLSWRAAELFRQRFVSFSGRFSTFGFSVVGIFYFPAGVFVLPAAFRRLFAPPPHRPRRQLDILKDNCIV